MRSLVLPAFLPVAACAVLLLLVASVDARSLSLAQFSAELQVLAGGDVLVTETIRPRFEGAWNGLERTIPVEYRTPQGFNYSLRLTPVSVTDETGAPLRYERRRDRHYQVFRIWVPGAVDAVRTVVLTYRVEHALKFFEDHDELYWNVTGDEWDVPIAQASARILLPANATGVRALAFTGAYGAREQAADVEITGPEVVFRMRRPLGFREGLTAVVGWDKGVIAEPGPLALAWFFLRSNWPLAVPLVVLGVMGYLWYTRGRDPRLRPVAVAYEPPEQLSPAEVGTLVDNSPDLRDVTATLVDLAVRGLLRIEERRESRAFGLWSGTEFVFHFVAPASDWATLLPHERGLLNALSGEGTRKDVAVSDLENDFYRHVPSLRKLMFQRLLERRYYVRRPDHVRRSYLVGGVGFGILSGIGLAAVSEAHGMAPAAAVAAAALSALIIVGFGWLMPARTVKGARVLEKILGFEEFLSRVEAPRFDKVVKTPALFEKFLPFAMALGVEASWARAFEDIYKEPPSWYQGGDVARIQPRGLVGRLGHMASAAGTAMASAPRSSGGSGFGGGSSGGFSGGGFGGGGGRGF